MAEETEGRQPTPAVDVQPRALDAETAAELKRLELLVSFRRAYVIVATTVCVLFAAFLIVVALDLGRRLPLVVDGAPQFIPAVLLGILIAPTLLKHSLSVWRYGEQRVRELRTGQRVAHPQALRDAMSLGTLGSLVCAGAALLQLKHLDGVIGADAVDVGTTLMVAGYVVVLWATLKVTLLRFRSRTRVPDAIPTLVPWYGHWVLAILLGWFALAQVRFMAAILGGGE